MTGRRSVNISRSASGHGLREELDKVAHGRALTRSKITEKILIYAINHKSKFAQPVKKPRQKPGEHISTTVTESVIKELNRWAKEKEASRSLFCCYIIEKALEDNLIDEILNSASPKSFRYNDDDDEDDDEEDS